MQSATQVRCRFCIAARHIEHDPRIAHQLRTGISLINERNECGGGLVIIFRALCVCGNLRPVLRRAAYDGCCKNETEACHQFNFSPSCMDLPGNAPLTMPKFALPNCVFGA